MARIRYLKPQAAEDVRLAECSRDARLLYRDLWCHMDRQGLTEDEPRLIKRNVFPYDDDLTAAKVAKLVGELVSVGRLVRITWKGHALLFCPTLERHQNFHPDEKPKFRIPKDELEKLVQQSGDQLQAGFDGLASTTGTGNRNGEQELSTGDAKNSRTPPLLRIWNENRGPLAEARECKPGTARGKAAAARWRENPDAEFWAGVVRRLAASPFCRGETDRGTWRATFDFLIQPETATKTLEGKYDPPAKKNGIATTLLDPITLEARQ